MWLCKLNASGEFVQGFCSLGYEHVAAVVLFRQDMLEGLKIGFGKLAGTTSASSSSSSSSLTLAFTYKIVIPLDTIGLTLMVLL